jgi:hypothetical protein
MTRLVAALLLVTGLLASQAVSAQVVFLTTPPGGFTVKEFATKMDGWSLLTFVEAVPELATCPSITWGAKVYQNAVWIDPAPAGGKHLHNQLVLARMTGKRVANVAVEKPPCLLHILHVAD